MGNFFSENGEKSKATQNQSKIPSKNRNSVQFSSIFTEIYEFIDENVLKNAIFQQNFAKFPQISKRY